MVKWMKYVSLAALFKDIRVSYEEEKGKERPSYLSRRFIGSVVALAGAFLAVHYGVELDPETLTNLSDNLEKFISVGVTIYGIVLSIYGYINRKK